MLLVYLAESLRRVSGLDLVMAELPPLAAAL